MFMKVSSSNRAAFWRSFLLALETDPVEPKDLKGASGLIHPVIALGVDRNRKRLVVISGDPDGRSAVLAQSDIQASIPEYRVILARPIAVDLSKFAKALIDIIGKSEIGESDLKVLAQRGKKTEKQIERATKRFAEAGVLPALQAISYAALRAPATWQDVIMQLSHLQFISPAPSIEANSDKPAEELNIPTIQLGPLVALDPAEIDRMVGVCSVPLYELSNEEAELFHVGDDIEAMRSALYSHDIIQYFFPPPDHLALGLIDREPTSADELLRRVGYAPDLGHPLGSNELLPAGVHFDQIIEALKAQGYSSEGEFGIELTEKGVETRVSVRFKPREGILSKISRIFSIKIDISLRDLLGLK